MEQTRTAATTEEPARTVRPPALLPAPDGWGSVAAIRTLGRAGIEVHVALPPGLAPARSSRHAARVLACPDPGVEPAAFVAWLVAEGKRLPGRVLLPTTDDVAWLYARHREELSRWYALDLPALDVAYALLNKWRLHEACRAVRIPTPFTALPCDAEELRRLREELPYPLVVKPQTQVLLHPHQKGRVVAGPAELEGLHAAFRAETRHAPVLREADPAVSWPLLQEYVELGDEGIYSLAGWAGPGGELVVQASRKMLQIPRRLGIGLCFEEAEVKPALVEGLRALCRHVGYHGPLEVEYLARGGTHLLIDFNPRFYGQMAFDVDRGIPVPLLAYLSAIGDRDALLAAAAKASAAARRLDGWIYCPRFETSFWLRMLAVAGRLETGEAARWRGWCRDGRGRLVDPARDADDPMPGLVDGARVVWRSLRHPRSFWRALRRG